MEPIERTIIYFMTNFKDGHCINPKCNCHQKGHEVKTPFPFEYPPIYCCNHCASTRQWAIVDEKINIE